MGGSGPSRKGSLVRDNHIKAVKSSNRRGFDLDTVCSRPSLLVKKITLAFYAICPAKNAIDWCPMQEGCRKVHSNFTHMYNIGDRLREERLSRDYSMEYVAGKLQVNPTTIYRMENKAKSFRTALLVGYCELLEIDPAELFADSAMEGKYRELMKYLQKILLICSNIIIGLLKNNALFREIIKDLIREILDEREVHKSEKGEEA